MEHLPAEKNYHLEPPTRPDPPPVSRSRTAAGECSGNDRRLRGSLVMEHIGSLVSGVAERPTG